MRQSDYSEENEQQLKNDIQSLEDDAWEQSVSKRRLWQSLQLLATVLFCCIFAYAMWGVGTKDWKALMIAFFLLITDFSLYMSSGYFYSKWRDIERKEFEKDFEN